MGPENDRYGHLMYQLCGIRPDGKGGWVQCTAHCTTQGHGTCNLSHTKLTHIPTVMFGTYLPVIRNYRAA
jgi:hypothetical protein